MQSLAYQPNRFVLHVSNLVIKKRAGVFLILYLLYKYAKEWWKEDIIDVNYICFLILLSIESSYNLKHELAHWNLCIGEEGGKGDIAQ